MKNENSNVIELLERQLNKLFEIGDSFREDAPLLYEQKIERWQRNTNDIISSRLGEYEIGLGLSKIK